MAANEPSPAGQLAARRRLGGVFGALTASAGLLALLAGFRLASFNLPATPWRVPGEWVIGAGLALTLLGFTLRWLRPRLGLLVATLAWLALGLGWAGIHPPRSGERWLTRPGTPVVWTSETEWFEGYIQFDDRFGHKGIPNIRARQHAREFDVHYTQDQDGVRVMPAPSGPEPHPEILFLGCSFTYGIGVEDGETYPAILAAEAWPEYRVRNLACSAYGSTHCLLVLRAALEGSTHPAPAAVFYGFIGEHLKRNSLRASWQNRMGTGLVPHFDPEGRFLGIIPSVRATLPDTPATDEVERRTTRTVIRAMRDLCAERNVPFFLLVLQEQNHGIVGELRQDLGDRLLDLTAQCADVYDHDGHPTPRAHRQIAQALASNPLIARATGLAALLQPDAVAAPGYADSLRLKLNPEGKRSWASRIEPKGEAGPVRLESIEREGRSPYEVGLTRPALAVQKDGRYVVRIRARADRARRVLLNVTGVLPPFADCGFSREVLLTGLWRDYAFPWRGSRDEAHARVSVFAGGSDVPIEVERLEVAGLDPEAWRGFWVETDEGDVRNHARLMAARGGQGQSFRLDQLSSPHADPWRVRVARRGYQLVKGITYRLRGRAHSDLRRPVAIVVLRDAEPYPDAGLAESLELTRQWLAFDYTFAATHSGPAVLTIQAGQSEVPLEFEDIALEAAESP